jgi:hypothetical protein
MVRALLDGRKTQTRRAVVPQPRGLPLKDQSIVCRFGAPGDTLWVRESRFMSRAEARITLRITSRRLERVQDISLADARAEGFDPDILLIDPVHWFRELWDRLHADRGLAWRKNPWVWVIGFRLITPAS